MSVHRTGGGITSRMPARWHLSFIVLRNPELLATPPASAMTFAPVSFAARTALSLSSSTAAYWKLAAMSAAGTSCPLWRSLWTALISAVLSPEKL